MDRAMKRSILLPRWALPSALIIGLLSLACGSDGGGGNAMSAGGTAGSGGLTGGAGSFGAGSGGTSFAGAGAAGAAGGSETADSGASGASSGGAGFGGAGGGGAGIGGAASGGTGVGGAGGGGASNATAGAGGSAGQGGGAGTGGVAAFNPCPTAGAACIVMPLGDSITDGVGSSAPGGGYRVQLFHDAVQAHKALTFVGSATDPNGPAMVDGKTFPRNHEGHPGYTIDNSATTSGISPLVDQSLATNHPQIILLMIGTNDLSDLANAPTRLAALLDRMINDAPNALLVVAQINPTRDDGANSIIRTYNDAIAGLVQTRAANGKHITTVDMYAAITAQTSYRTDLMSDFLHPNDAGYVVMGDVWYAAIQSYLPAAP
jgi:lysophospholipase L1-like esterase